LHYNIASGETFGVVEIELKVVGHAGTSGAAAAAAAATAAAGIATSAAR
jgi:hypothetical protein